MCPWGVMMEPEPVLAELGPVGTITRTEGEIDRRTRQLTVVARVDEPYARDESGERPPLAIGMFVAATIRGRTFRDVIVIPRIALRGDGEVWVLDGENNLRRRAVEVLRTETERVLVRAGLDDGDVVCVTPLDAPVDGMPVRRLPADSALSEPIPTPATQNR